MPAPLGDDERLGDSIADESDEEDELHLLRRPSSEISLARRLMNGDDPDEVVTAFCATHMAGAGESCSKQLLPHVTSKIAAM